MVRGRAVYASALLVSVCSCVPCLAADRAMLSKYGLRASTLNGLPEWAIKYASLIAGYIDDEARLLPLALCKIKVGWRGWFPLVCGCVCLECRAVPRCR